MTNGEFRDYVLRSFPGARCSGEPSPKGGFQRGREWRVLSVSGAVIGWGTNPLAAWANAYHRLATSDL